MGRGTGFIAGKGLGETLYVPATGQVSGRNLHVQQWGHVHCVRYDTGGRGTNSEGLFDPTAV
ncbi:hypothetical protein D3C76_1617370 [compost metagenome]